MNKDILKELKEIKQILKNHEGRFTSIEKTQTKILDNQSAMDVDLTRDRRDIDQSKVEMVSLKEAVENVSGQITRLQGKTVEAVTNAISETTEPLRAEVQELNKKPVINVTDKQAKNISWIRKVYAKIAEWKR